LVVVSYPFCIIRVYVVEVVGFVDNPYSSFILYTGGKFERRTVGIAGDGMLLQVPMSRDDMCDV
jgi:hypothetical protein